MALEVIERGQKYTRYRDPAWVPGRLYSIITEHDQHYDTGDGVYDKPVAETYDALTADAGGYTSSADQMRHTLKVDDIGNRLWLPRRNVGSQSIRFGRPEYSLNPLAQTPTWNTLPLGAPTRNGRLVVFTRPNYVVGFGVTWRKILFGWQLTSPMADIVGLRIPITLTGLQFDKWQLKSGSLVLATVSVEDAVDAAGKAFPVTRRYSGGYVEYTMDLTGAQYPVTVTPLNDTLAVESSTGDDYVQGTNADYNTAHTTGSTSNAGDTASRLGQLLYSGNYYCYRLFFKFDTSSLPDDCTINQVNLTLTCTTDESDTDFDVQVVKEDWSAYDPIDTGSNKAGAYSDALTAALDDAIWRNTSGMSTNTQYASGNLSTTWVSKTGSTYYSLISSRDRAATQPTGGERITIAMADHTTASYRPSLAVIYTAAGGATLASRRALLGVGL